MFLYFSAYALKCYICNGARDKYCNDPFDSNRHKLMECGNSGVVCAKVKDCKFMHFSIKSTIMN